MTGDFLPVRGVLVPPSALTLPRARSLADILWANRLDFVRPVESYSRIDEASSTTAETIVFDVEVERPQLLTHNIRRTERIAVEFSTADDAYPEVLALRPDFPNVPHLNLRPQEFPRSLCLYDHSWDQVRLRWTPTACVERIRHWLAETAKGTLHADDQPLEPLLFGCGIQIVLPPDLFSPSKTDDPEFLDVVRIGSPDEFRLLVAGRGFPGEKTENLEYVALPLATDPQSGNIIRHTPVNLKQLHDFLLPCNINLIDYLRERIRASFDTKGFVQKKPILVIAFPRIRDGAETIETTNLWAFLITSTIGDIGVSLDVLAKSDGEYGCVVGDAYRATADGSDISVVVLSPLFALTRASTARSNATTPDDRPILNVGAGALGSQAIELLLKSGFGTWTIIDHDILLPHNPPRHALPPYAVGYPKASLLAHQLASYFETQQPHRSIVVDILHPNAHKKAIDDAATAAGLILDCAADIAVSRHIAIDLTGDGRRASVFLNPSGTDLVLLIEDENRRYRLDYLEMQYYRALLTRADLANHLSPPVGRLRYARSCRDVSAVMPNHLVAMHAAIAANALRRSIASPGPSIHIWRSDPQWHTVSDIQIEATTVAQQEIGGWKLILDRAVLNTLAQARLAELPNETGGVLIGTHDFTRRILYVVDTIPAPPDSVKWPTLYIRGAKGLFPRVEEIRTITSGELDYVGEWHSHPDGCPCLPSEDDLKVFAWLTEHLADDGKPALMAIAGENDTSAWFLGQMLRSGGYEVRLPIDDLE